MRAISIPLAIAFQVTLAAAPATQVWLESSLKRVFPNSPAGSATELKLLSGRNQRLSFQACIRNKDANAVRVECTVAAPDGIAAQVRRVGYVPMQHHTPRVDLSEQDGVGMIPGLVPDPLFPETTVNVGPSENQSFWITLTVPAGVAPGMKEIKVRLVADQGKNKPKLDLGELTTRLDVRPLTLKPRRDFPVTHWWQPDGLYDWYKIPPFGDEWWRITEPYLRNMASHGSNVIFVPVFHIRREIVPNPPQLLKVTEPAPGRYEFDFSEVSRFVRLAKSTGMEYFEFPHLFLYWGVRNPIHVYKRDGTGWALLWPTETDATGPVYRNFLAQYLPALRRFLDAEGIFDRSLFHLSDEPKGDEHFGNYKKARTLLREIAPWMKVMDALSEVRYGKTGECDMPVPQLPAAEEYIDAKLPHWVYYCTSPRGKYLNRFFDTPLAKVRMSGWLFYHLGAKGFLHWGYAYWYKIETQQLINPFQDGASADWPNIPYGDPFVVYPGADGPIDSIRWEVFAESMQDYALLQTAGIRPDDPLLADLKSYSEFPKNEAWIQHAIAKILTK